MRLLGAAVESTVTIVLNERSTAECLVEVPLSALADVREGDVVS